MTTKEEELRGEEVRRVSMIIANTLTEHEVEFGVALLALTMILTKAAIDCEIDRDTLMESLEASTKLLYDNLEDEDNLTGGEYVQ